MMRAPLHTAEAAARDPLDLHMERLGVSRRSGWSKVSSQGTLLLLAGMALGPQGVAILTPEILDVIQPAVPVALAVLGVTAVLRFMEPGTFSRLPSHLSSAVILVTGLALAVQQRPVPEALAMLIQAASIAILLAGAGWVVSSRGASDEERRVFSIATFLLLGGVADYLSVSGLLLGWVAATAWRFVKTPGLADVRLDATYVQHPVTALLLVAAGAHVQFSWRIALLAVAAVCMVMATALVLRGRRTVGVTFDNCPLTPAAFAVALAMDAARLDGRLATVLSVVVLAASALEVFSIHGKPEAA